MRLPLAHPRLGTNALHSAGSRLPLNCVCGSPEAGDEVNHKDLVRIRLNVVLEQSQDPLQGHVAWLLPHQIGYLLWGLDLD